LISDTRDPFFNLPPDLLLYLFDFSHPFDVWSKRVICRRWNTVLSSDAFTHAALNRFATHDPADSALDPRTQSTENLALRHIQALRNGRPFSYVNISDKFAFLPTSHPVAHQLRLKGKHIAYLRGNAETRESTTVVVKDLTTGEVTSLCGNAREKIMLIELTSDVVAFFTYVGTMYVVPLLNLTASLEPIRLPSSSIVATGAGQGVLACVLKGVAALTVVVHDTSRRKSTSFDLEDSYDLIYRSRDSYAILPDSDKRFADVFSSSEQIRDSKLHVKVLRYSLTGKCIARTSLTIWHGLQNLSRVSLGSLLPTGERGLYQLGLSYEGPMTPDERRTLPNVRERIRDHDRSVRWTLLFDTIAYDLKAIDLTSTTESFRTSEFPDSALWKDRRYRGEPREMRLIDTAQRGAPFDGPHTLRRMPNEAKTEPVQFEEMTDEQAMLAARLARGETALSWRPSDFSSWQAKPQYYEQVPRGIRPESPPPSRYGAMQTFHSIVAMNDSFAVGTSLDSGNIVVACFDERVALHGSESTGFREGMTREDFVAREIESGILRTKRRMHLRNDVPQPEMYSIRLAAETAARWIEHR
jgi:hypothetical protein